MQKVLLIGYEKSWIKMREELISVVIPVYNVENYLERCVRSVLHQTYTNYEILLIDDGSEDSSAGLCDQLAVKYDKIKAFHKKNGGLGSARNYGIERANGSYLCFVDSDDKVDSEYLRSLYRGIKKENADLCVCGYFYSAGKYTAEYRLQDSFLSITDMLKKLACGNAFFNFAWNKLYKKEVLDQMSMHFGDRHCAEDLYFNVIYDRYVARVALVQKPLYTYYVNLESLSNGRRENFWSDMLLVYDEFRATCTKKQVPVDYANNLLTVMFRNSISNFFNQETSLSECRQYVECCMRRKNLSKESVRIAELGTLDRHLYHAVLKKAYRTIYIDLKLIKWIKGKHFQLFCKIRETVFRK